ncbi:MAG: phosphate ABC transporter substrate-binding protein [Pirellulales bacterium]|nr:phosphate ABC transporter substrate-binding protein [Pirellulales bacterium]
MNNRFFIPFLLAGFLLLNCLGCGSSSRKDKDTDGKKSNGSETSIRAEGSDTMVNLAQAWAETYHGKRADVNIQVLGGGSGVGIASLINGTCDMANASRKMKDKELQSAVKKSGVEPVEHIVGYDALAVYVHKDNPIDSISIEELAEIYGDGGKITDWSQIEGGKKLEITRVSRQNNSGTYAYFREAVLGKNRDYKLGSIDQSGSKDVVALVSKTPGAIGYSGMGYATPEVKMLKISKKKGEPGTAPTMENAIKGAYPITRPLHIYTLGEPEGVVAEYLEWINSEEGQAVVSELGYVPAAKK